MTENKGSQLLNQHIDYYKVVRILWSRWYWIAGCVLLALTIAWLYLWYTPKSYSTTASLKFNEDRSELAGLLKSNTPYYDRTNKVQAEMYVIQSRQVVLNAISRLDYKVSYFLKGRVRTSDIYPQIPFPIEIIRQDSIGFFQGMFDIVQIEKNTFRLSYSAGDNYFEKDYRYGEVVEAPGVAFRVKHGSGPSSATYSFRFNRPETFLGRVTSGLAMREAAKSSNVLLLTLTDKNPAFARDVLNAILQEYIEYDHESKSQSASQMIEFIEGQLAFLVSQVRHSGSELAKFKQEKNLVDLSTSTQIYVGKLTNFQTQKNLLKIQELAIDQLEEQIRNNKDHVNLNFSLEGSVDPLLAGLINQLNSLIIEKEKALSRFQSGSKPVEQLDSQIAEIKKAIINNIRLLRERTQKTIRYIDNQIELTQQGLKGLPNAEKDYVNLQADFDINQKVFSYLSEKKLEAQISRAAVVPGASVVEAATSSYQIVAPVSGKIYSSALMLGLLSGIGLIFLVRIINPYIYDKEMVESLTKIPIIGIIRRFPAYIDKDNRQILSLEKPKSVYAESVRSVRTNISFLASEKKSKVICVTSEIAGEGKSFVSVNLASTLALIEKRVLLIGADLRMSKLHNTFGIDNKRGLSTCLSAQHDIKDLIYKTKIENLDFLPSGPVPPNPSELLHKQQLKDLLADLRAEYDFILLDTAPVGLVSDSIPLIRNADINLFVIRSGISHYNAATVPDRLSMEYDLKNIVIVLNAFDENVLHSRYYTTDYASSSYNNYYYYSDYSGSSSYYSRYSGYGYYTEDEDRPKWWEFWKKR